MSHRPDTAVSSEAWAKLREWAILASKGRLLLSGSVVFASLKAAVQTWREQEPSEFVRQTSVANASNLSTPQVTGNGSRVGGGIVFPRF